jgi:malate dehydrogenase (oxaloacetate-decarboxylating)
MIERDEIFRIRTRRTPGTLARALAAIGDHGAHIGEIETLAITREFNVRDVTVIAPSDDSIEAIRSSLESLDGVELVEQSTDKVFAIHEGGKIAISSTVEIRNLQDVREVYTPGVARVSQAIAADESVADTHTWRGKTVAVVTDGSRVLGLGDVGPAAALPVMEGKALFYSTLVDLNAVPIVLDTNDPDEIVETVIRIAPGFGGIHLEDIATPGVYAVERDLIDRLDIPVMHDDQHGTAVVLMAAVLSAARLDSRSIEDLTFGQIGLGAAGSAIARLATEFPFRRVMASDPVIDSVKRLEGTDVEAHSDSEAMARVMADADVVSLTTGRPGLLDPSLVRDGQIVFALSNPLPEITMEAARSAGASIAADGSVVNNLLAYPGLFKGALLARANQITSTMRRAAAEALSELAPDGQLLPDPLDRSVHAAVAERVAQAAG